MQLWVHLAVHLKAWSLILVLALTLALFWIWILTLMWVQLEYPRYSALLVGIYPKVSLVSRSMWRIICDTCIVLPMNGRTRNRLEDVSLGLANVHVHDFRMNKRQ